MRHILIALAVFVAGLGATIPAAHAAEPILGAFGLMLGDRFDTTKAKEKNSLDNGLVQCQFVPKTDIPFFDTYQVTVTPTANLIVRITGSTTFPDRKALEKRLAMLSDMLQDKYGPIVLKIFPPTIRQGDRSIVIDPGKAKNALTLRLTYTDEAMLAQATSLAPGQGPAKGSKEAGPATGTAPQATPSTGTPATAPAKTPAVK